MKALQLVHSLRRQPTTSLSTAHCLMATRGGKKKKGGGGAADGPMTSDIVNIWKDRPDPVIKPTDDYPQYVADALKP